MSNAITFNDDDSWKKSAIHFLDDSPKVIMITKHDRTHVIGNQLYVKFNGVEIYTDLDHVIYINKELSQIQIKEYKELTPPNEREYLLLLTFHESEEEPSTFEGVVGRQETFDYIKANAEQIDMHNSLILAETVAFKDAISIYKFMNDCIVNSTVVNEDGFDLSDYSLDED